jgi:D-alanyl-D-alanine carboxypeptidase
MLRASTKVYSLAILSLLIIASALIYHARQFAIKEGIPKVSLQPTTSGGNKYTDPNIKPLVTQSGAQASATSSPKKAVAPAPPAVPVVTAESYLIGNLDSGEVYVSKSPDKITPIASISKLVTALTLEDMYSSGVLNHDSRITITDKMLEPDGTEGRLAVGETFTSGELMYPLVLESSNDAAEAFAIVSGYDHFIFSMNQRVQNLGMKNSTFSDPSGLSEKNLSNAKDLFTLAVYLYKNKPELLQLTRTPTYTLASTTEHSEHVFKNTNPFVGDPHYIGGKTGRTIPAKETMLSLFNYTVGSSTYPVAIIVLRSDFNSRQYDASLLFEQFLEKIDGAR